MGKTEHPLASPVAACPSFHIVAPQRLHLNSDWPQAAPTRTGRLAVPIHNTGNYLFPSPALAAIKDAQTSGRLVCRETPIGDILQNLDELLAGAADDGRLANQNSLPSR